MFPLILGERGGERDQLVVSCTHQPGMEPTTCTYPDCELNPQPFGSLTNLLSHVARAKINISYKSNKKVVRNSKGRDHISNSNIFFFVVVVKDQNLC